MPPTPRSRDVWAVGTAAFLFHLIAVCPGLYWHDAGELTTAGASLGIAHPTGFPAWCLSAKFATFLPFGTIAFRVALLSALSGGLCAGAVTALVQRLVPGSLVGRVTAITAGLAILLNPTLDLHAETAEVYGPTAAVLLALWVAATRGDTRGALMAGALTGLLGGLHGASAALPAAIGVVVACRGPGAVRRFALATGLGVLAAVVIVYLPVRAAQQPWSNWGSPDTLGRLWDHLSGARIRASFSGEMAGLQRAPITAMWALRQLWEQSGGLVVLAPLGVFALRRQWRLAAMLALGVIADLAYTAFVNPMGMRDAQTGVNAAVGVVVLAGVGAAWLGAWVPRLAGVPLAAASLLVLGALAAPRLDVSHSVTPGDLASVLLEPLPADSLAFVSSDDVASTSLYAQAFEGVRPDVLVIVKQHASDPISAAALAARDTLDRVPPGPPPPGPTAALTTWLSRNRRRFEIVWEVGDGVTDGLVADGRLGAPWLRLAKTPRVDAPGTSATETTHAETTHAETTHADAITADLDGLAARWRAISGDVEDVDAMNYLGRMASLAGVFALGRGDAALGEPLIATGASLAPTDPKTMLNAGARLLDHGEPEAAKVLLTRAADVLPDSTVAFFNLGLAAAQTGDLVGARARLLHAARLGLSPSRAARALEALAVAEANAGHFDRALVLLEVARAQLPKSSQAAAQQTVERLVQRVLRP